MGRGRKRKNVAKVPVVEGSAVIVDNEGTAPASGQGSSLEPGCAVVSLRRFPAVLKERIGILQARRKVAGVKDETLEMLHALVAELGVVELEKELTQFEAQERAAVVEQDELQESQELHSQERLFLFEKDLRHLIEKHLENL